MRQAERQTKKKPKALPGQLDLFGAPEAANKPATQAANDALALVHATRTAIPLAAPEALITAAPNAMIANNNEPEKRKRGRPRKTTFLAAPPSAASKSVDARDRHSEAVRDEWWNSQMVCAFLKISRKTLWERRRAKGLNFPPPVLLGGARNLYRASAIRAWADRIADAEF